MHNNTESQAKPSFNSAADKLLTPREVAAILRVSMTGVYRIVERREIPFFRFRQKLRFRVADVEEYIASSRVASIQERWPGK